jgi:Protein of unknown function (DUF2793)
MSEAATARHGLPNLFVGQAQKEVTHNEALARIDALLHPVVEDQIAAPPPSLGVESDGLCWLIADMATGLWSGRDGQIARWSGGSWRYLIPVEGMIVWHALGNKRLFYIAGDWVETTAIGDPAGGAVADAEARLAIISILGHLRQISHIPS